MARFGKERHGSLNGWIGVTQEATMPLACRCHCERNAFEIDGELPEALTRCTCSFCSKRGHLYAYFRPDQFKVTQADSDAVYPWQTKQVVNHFCSACGCDLYADSPDFGNDGSCDGKTRRICVNARLLDNFEAADWPVTVLDGKHLW
jgi:hypothetical protein